MSEIGVSSRLSNATSGSDCRLDTGVSSDVTKPRLELYANMERDCAVDPGRSEDIRAHVMCGREITLLLLQLVYDV